VGNHGIVGNLLPPIGLFGKPHSQDRSELESFLLDMAAGQMPEHHQMVQ